jgi:hypothetical protein
VVYSGVCYVVQHPDKKGQWYREMNKCIAQIVKQLM